MILDKETVDKFGYTQEDCQVSKPVVVQCDYCGLIFDKRKFSLIRSRKVIQKDCCKKCRYIKNKEICVVKYGCENILKSNHIKEKIKKTCLERYGCENPFGNKDIQEKIKETNLERYGAENPFQSEICKDKIKEVLIQKYGVDNISKSEEIKQKKSETTLKNFGTKSPIQSLIVKEKTKQTNLKKYKVENVFANKEIQEKISEFNFKNYGVDNFAKTEEFREIRRGQRKKYNGKTIDEWAKELGIAYSTFTMRRIKYGVEKAISMDKRQSSLEQIISKVLQNLSIDFQREKYFDNKRADFCIESHKLIIECDGIFWHSDRFLDDNYHKEKLDLYEGCGYTALFFREDEINNKLSIVESIIKNKLGLSERIYGRKCSIKLIDKKVIKEFLNENHLMGAGSGRAYGLYHNGELVALMQFKVEKKIDIVRFCTKKGTSVIGGYSKLLAYISRFFSLPIVNFVDRRYGSGKHLEKLGFKKESEYLSFKWINGKDCFHRMTFPGNSGYDNGFVKLWDCGQAKYVKNSI